MGSDFLGVDGICTFCFGGVIIRVEGIFRVFRVDIITRLEQAWLHGHFAHAQ